MTVCTHLCRANFASAWVAESRYDPVTEVLFNELKVDGYFLEFDSPRPGNFTPLRYLAGGKRLNLGLVTTQTGEPGIGASARMPPSDGWLLNGLRLIVASVKSGGR
jgi:hypothetical protein